MTKEKRNYSACFNTPIAFKDAKKEVCRLVKSGVTHLYFEFYLIDKVQHHEPDMQPPTSIMNACEAYNWIAGLSKAVRVTCDILVMLYE